MLVFARRHELKIQPVGIPALVRGMTELLERSLGASVMIETRFPLDWKASRTCSSVRSTLPSRAG